MPIIERMMVRQLGNRRGERFFAPYLGMPQILDADHPQKSIAHGFNRGMANAESESRGRSMPL